MDEFGKSLNNSKNDNSKTKFLHTKANKINVLLFSIIKEEIIKRRRTINTGFFISKKDENIKNDKTNKNSKKIILEPGKNPVVNNENLFSNNSEEDSSDMSCEEEIII